MLHCLRSTGFLLIALFLMFSFFRCRKNKAAASEVGTWLEKQFPGQFALLETKSGATWSNYNLNLYKVQIAHRADEDAQFSITWDKGQVDGGISRNLIEQLSRAAREGVARSRSILKVLKDNGLDKVSVGSSGGFVDILVFSEDSLAGAKLPLAALEAALRSMPEVGPALTQIYFLEASAYGERFQDLEPADQVGKLHANTWKADYTVFIVEPAEEADIPLHTWLGGYRINSLSNRAVLYQKAAYAAVKTWAEKHLPPGAYMENNHVEYDTNGKGRMGIAFVFPWCRQPVTDPNMEEPTCEEAEGYVSCLYHADSGKTDKIKVLKGE